MSRIQWYLFRNLGVALLYATGGLTLTIWLSQSLRLIELVVEAGAPIRLFFWLLLLTVPTFLGIVLPIAVAASVLFIYNKLTMDSELVVMRAAGVGPLALAKPAMALAGLVTLTVYGLNLYITPAAHRELVRMEYAVREDYSQLFVREGVFNDIGDKLSVYVRERTPEGELGGVLIHDARQPEAPVTIFGERALMVADDTGARFVVFNGNRQELERATGRLSQLFFERYAVDLSVEAKQVGERQPDARERSTLELLSPPAELAADRRASLHMASEFHHRLSSPLLALTFAAVALAALLSGEFNRRGQSLRVTVAILLVVLIQAAMLGFTSLTTKGTAFVPFLYAVPLAALAPAVWVLGRARTRGWRAAAAPM